MHDVSNPMQTCICNRWYAFPYRKPIIVAFSSLDSFAGKT